MKNAATFLNVILNNILYILKKSVYPISVLLLIALPYIMYFLCVRQFKENGYIVVGRELLIPVAVFTFYFIVMYYRKTSKIYGIPIPKKRYTMIEGDEVQVDTIDMQDIILYMCELEDYFERNEMTKEK